MTYRLTVNGAPFGPLHSNWRSAADAAVENGFAVWSREAPGELTWFSFGVWSIEEFEVGSGPLKKFRYRFFHRAKNQRTGRLLTKSDPKTNSLEVEASDIGEALVKIGQKPIPDDATDLEVWRFYP